METPPPPPPTDEQAADYPQKRFFRSRAHCNPLSHNDAAPYPRDPSALPSNHEIVSYGCEVSPRAISSWRSHCDPHPQLEQTQGEAWPTQSKQYYEAFS